RSTNREKPYECEQRSRLCADREPHPRQRRPSGFYDPCRRGIIRVDAWQLHGLFHGGVTAFLVDNATTIAAATSRGQPALTAEYKLNLLSPAVGERLICRARVIKPGRQVAVVAADVFCVIDGKEKHTATALASIAMLEEKAAARIPGPA